MLEERGAGCVSRRCGILFPHHCPVWVYTSWPAFPSVSKPPWWQTLPAGRADGHWFNNLELEFSITRHMKDKGKTYMREAWLSAWSTSCQDRCGWQSGTPGPLPSSGAGVIFQNIISNPSISGHTWKFHLMCSKFRSRFWELTTHSYVCNWLMGIPFDFRKWALWGNFHFKDKEAQRQ